MAAFWCLNKFGAARRDDYTFRCRDIRSWADPSVKLRTKLTLTDESAVQGVRGARGRLPLRRLHLRGLQDSLTIDKNALSVWVDAHALTSPVTQRARRGRLNRHSDLRLPPALFAQCLRRDISSANLLGRCCCCINWKATLEILKPLKYTRFSLIYINP
ncbi:hypothetical protein EVAR_37050_1 [Eumeta japonica]|uniref:Uncharacterized protein n=1 Tax=Eumeta variegata TaxID=151549 RepID=A0A4C1WIP1_EUMVA|nr:hypothetical protein EVAR_37050_1 [Eumeta japonica]